jgi:hypothetical protein
MDIKRPFSTFEWHTLPKTVRVYISTLAQNIVALSDKIEPLEKRIEQLEARLNQSVCFFLVHPNRSPNAFQARVKVWLFPDLLRRGVLRS